MPRKPKIVRKDISQRDFIGGIDPPSEADWVSVNLCGIHESDGMPDFIADLQTADGSMGLEIDVPPGVFTHLAFIVSGHLQNSLYPSPYSMIASMASACRRRITAVVIDSREGDLLRAKVVVEGQKSKFLLEAGAAEAIVLAMTASAPIYAVRSLLMAGEQESEGEMFPPRRSS